MSRPFLILNGAKAESADCHSVADECEHLGRDQLCIGEIADRDVLGAEVEIFGTAEEGIAVLGAVLRLEAFELDLVAFHEVSDLHPKLVVGGQQIDGRHQGEVLLVELADRLNKSKPVFFISEVHIEFLTFSDELIEPSAKGGVVDVLHCLSHNLGSVYSSGNDSFLNTWALADCAFSFSVVVEAKAAVAHLCRVFKIVLNSQPTASWSESWNGSHHPFHCSLLG